MNPLAPVTMIRMWKCSSADEIPGAAAPLRLVVEPDIQPCRGRNPQTCDRASEQCTGHLVLGAGWMTSVAVIGCGYWGRNLVRNFHQLAALAAIHDADPRTAAKISSEYGVAALDFEAILDSDIPAVVISAPAEQH